MRLFIAEKPELAKAIVAGLGGGQRKQGYIDCGSDKVTWCFGHMLQLLDPEDYDEKYKQWNMGDLPIAHIPWRKKVASDKKDQVKVILSLLKEADLVVHAGDPDEEGQLLVDEILEHAHCRLPVKRVLINDNNTKVVKKALDNLRDNSEFAGLSAAAEARSVCDQLYGYNMTRAYTLAARKAGYQGVLSVGRVQTPVLGLVVRRDRQHAEHKKAYYYNVTGDFSFQGVGFTARYQVTESDPVDDKNRLTDPEHAQRIADAIQGQPAETAKVDTKKKVQQPPLPYNLLKLQTDASRKFGFKPDQVKDITQSLREKHKLITYNRSDCEYLSDEQHADAPGVLSAIASTAPALARAANVADPTIKSRAFNSDKVSAHHGIIPTEATADLSNLSEGEQKIYLLVARAYVAQFWPKHEYDQTSVTVKTEGHTFAARANVTTQAGWLTLYKNDADNEDLQGDEADLSADLRQLSAGMQGTCTDARSEKMETKPQPLYTMATLLSDLTRVAKYIKDDHLKKTLQEKDKEKAGEHGGIGTPATRDSIIATLFKRGYLAERGKQVVSTDTGRDFYDALPDQAKFPDMTALWHEQQKAIVAGDMDIQSFVKELMRYVEGEVATVKTQGVMGLKIDTHPCPECKEPLRRIKGKKGFFWGCTGYQEGCKFSCEDKAGKPGSTKKKAAIKISDKYQCQSCSKGLVRRPGKRKGSYFWGCSGYPECKEVYFDMKGVPNFNKQKASA